MRILIAVIAYNEERNIRSTLEELLQFYPPRDIVLIDNGSIDTTAAIAQSLGVPVLSHCTNTGRSMGTVKTYFLYAHRRGYDVLCQFDGDGQHLASEIHRILQPILDGEADYVIGSRFLEREGFQSTAVRRIGIRLFSALDSLLIGRRITDATSGMRAYSRRVIRFFGHSYDHEIMDTSQLLLLSYYSGARIHEVPVKMRERKHGFSEFRARGAVSFLVSGLVNAAGSWLQRHQARIAGGEHGH